LTALKKRVRDHSTGTAPKAKSSTGKRKLDIRSEETSSKKQKKNESTGSTVKVQEYGKINEGDSMQDENALNPNAKAPQAVNLTIGAKEYRHLWNQVRERLTIGKSKHEKIFYSHHICLYNRSKTKAAYCFLTWIKSRTSSASSKQQ